MDSKKEEYIAFATYNEQIDFWCKKHNIVREKSEVYYDFLFSLLTLIDETYLGSDVIKTQGDMINHFNWCFNKVTDNFEQERIFFIPKSTHYEYLWFFFYKGFYMCTTENKTEILIDYFKLLFNFTRIKTQSELESFTDMYKIFDQNLKKIN